MQIRKDESFDLVSYQVIHTGSTQTNHTFIMSHYQVKSHGSKSQVSVVQRGWGWWRGRRLQALVYDILPPTTALTEYAMGLEKLS